MLLAGAGLTELQGGYDCGGKGECGYDMLACGGHGRR